VFCREIGDVELTMMKVSNINNNESIREIIVKLVYIWSVSAIGMKVVSEGENIG
jgi:uncharacterized membrane protein YagU involved in acid resistance